MRVLQEFIAFVGEGSVSFPRNLSELSNAVTQFEKTYKDDAALRLAAIRLGILADRMEGCNETAREENRAPAHELLSEARAFETEAREAAGLPPRGDGEEKEKAKCKCVCDHRPAHNNQPGTIFTPSPSCPVHAWLVSLSDPRD